MCVFFEFLLMKKNYRHLHSILGSWFIFPTHPSLNSLTVVPANSKNIPSSSPTKSISSSSDVQNLFHQDFQPSEWCKVNKNNKFRETSRTGFLCHSPPFHINSFEAGLHSMPLAICFWWCCCIFQGFRTLETWGRSTHLEELKFVNASKSLLENSPYFFYFIFLGGGGNEGFLHHREIWW